MIKLEDNWPGSYRIREIADYSTFYRLEEIDGIHLVQYLLAIISRKFFSRTALDEDRAEKRISDELKERVDDERDVGDNGEANDEKNG